MKKAIAVLTCFTVIIIACHRKTVPTASAPQVTYSSGIKPLIEKSCTPCHIPSQGGKVASFDGIENVKKHIDDMITRVSLPQTDPKFMPFKQKKPALTAAEIQLLKDWKNGGMKE